MGGTPTLNDTLRPKHRQFSLEDVEDHYLEWLEKWIAEIESGPARHMPRPIQVDTREPGLENRQRRKSLVGSNPAPPPWSPSLFAIQRQMIEIRAYAGRFRTARGSGERDEARIRPICGSLYPRKSDSGATTKMRRTTSAARSLHIPSQQPRQRSYDRAARRQRITGSGRARFRDWYYRRTMNPAFH
jgi:hypothetical protein